MREAAGGGAGWGVHPVLRLARRQPYSAIAPASLIILRGLRATGRGGRRVFVGGLVAVCRLPPPAGHSAERDAVSHMKWQSEENVGLMEAAEWARHFAQLETDMDDLLARLFAAPPEKISEWVRSGRYVTGPELAEAGLAELIQ